MSPRSSKTPGGSPAPDVFVGLLFVSLAALITGITFLFLKLNEYNFQMSP